MISSLAVFRPPTIPQHPHQEVAAPAQQSGEVEVNEEELEFVLCAKSWCVRELLHLECSVGSWYCRFVQETGEPKPDQSAPFGEDANMEPPPQELDVVQYMSCTRVQRIFSFIWHIYLFTCSFRAPNNPTTPASGGCSTRAAKQRGGNA